MQAVLTSCWDSITVYVFSLAFENGLNLRIERGESGKRDRGRERKREEKGDSSLRSIFELNWNEDKVMKDFFFIN